MLKEWRGSFKATCLGILAVTAVAINGCGSKKDGGSYDMKTESIFADGCLNLGNLYASLHSMPQDGIVRSFTYDFVPSNKDENGNSPSSARR